MTGWWTTRADCWDPRRAYSVRPDLWPPGSVVSWYTDDDVVMLAEWHWEEYTSDLLDWSGEAEDLHLGAPGLAESLILASLVRLDLPGAATVLADHWDPCPRPEGPQ